MKLGSLTFLLGLSAAAIASAADSTSANIKFSDPSKPGLLRIYVSHGDVNIRGDNVDAVSVTSSADPEGSKRRDGLRVISSASSFAMQERDNVIELNYGSADGRRGGDNADFEIVVPRNTSVELTTGWGGDIEIGDLTGDVEIKNMNGEISLSGLSGGALVETMNGEIKAIFNAVTPGKPLSFTSMNGEIELHLPAETKANVRFRTQNGSILTDFEENALVTKTENLGMDPKTASEIARVASEVAREVTKAAREVAVEVRAAMEADRDGQANPKPEARASAPKPPRPPRAPSIPALAGGKVVSGTLNGGGVDIQAASMNGDIVVRKDAK